MSTCEKLSPENDPNPTDTYRIVDGKSLTHVFIKVHGEGGMFSIVGDSCNYSASFDHCGQAFGNATPDDLRRMLCTIPEAKVASLLSHNKATVFDFEDSMSSIKKDIDARIGLGLLDPEDKARMLNELVSVKFTSNLPVFLERLSNMTSVMEEVYNWNFENVAKERPNRAAADIVKNVWAPFVETIHEESPPLPAITIESLEFNP